MWIEICDTDGQPALMNFGPGNVRGVKVRVRNCPDYPESTVTMDNGNTVILNNSYNFFKSKLLYINEAVQPQLLQENDDKVEIEIPEPMKAPTGKVGSGEKPETIINKLTKKGGTTSSALE